MKRPLSRRLLDAAGKPRKRLVYGDLAMKNLMVIIETTGRIYWRWQGHVDGKVRQVRLGQYPHMDVGQARKAAAALTEARDLAKMYGERFEVPRFRKRAAPKSPNTRPIVSSPNPESRDCNWLWKEYMQREGGGKASGAEKQRCWDKDIAPFIGDKPYQSITYDDLAEIIAAKAEYAPGAANHLVSYIKRLFRWAVTRGRPFTKLANDPARDLVKPTEEKSKDRYLNEQEIVWFFMAADALKDDAFTDGLLMMIYNGTRRAETFHMQWTEFNERNGYWLIPGSRTKNGDSLLLPLAPTSRALLKRRSELSRKGPYVFPATRGTGSMSGFNKRMESFRDKMREMAAEDQGEAIDIPNWTIHDLRRTLRTGMGGLCTSEGESLVPSNVVERVINHRPHKIVWAYDINQYIAEKRRALLLWSEHLDLLRQRASQPSLKLAA
jgi:integrase